jgi:hypothetical protein
MSRVTKLRTILNASNAAKIEALCVWIADNCDRSIGWEQLSMQSGLTHNELITLFQLLKQQTPMTYIRRVKEHKKSTSSTHPQHELFAVLEEFAPTQD